MQRQVSAVSATATQTALGKTGHVIYTCQRGPEMVTVHTSFTQVEVQILVFKNTLVKVEVLTKLLYSSESKEALKCTELKSTHN